MPQKRPRMVSSQVTMTVRQTTVVMKEATRRGISFSDQLRRITDEWIERTQPLAAKLYEGKP